MSVLLAVCGILQIVGGVALFAPLPVAGAVLISGGILSIGLGALIKDVHILSKTLRKSLAQSQTDIPLTNQHRRQQPRPPVSEPKMNREGY